MTPDSVLFVPELDYDYYYEDYENKISKAEALREDAYWNYDYTYGAAAPGIQAPRVINQIMFLYNQLFSRYDATQGPFLLHRIIHVQAQSRRETLSHTA